MTGTPYAEVIGDPIAHSKSPLIHKFWLEKLGIEADYRRTRVTAGELAAFIAGRRSDPAWRGCNVTMPLKQTILAQIDEVDGRGAEIGAVNAIHLHDRRLVGTNTDVLGILDVLPAEHVPPGAKLEVCIIGAGGAARAVLAACRERPVPLVLFNVRDPDKAWPLLHEWRFGGSVGTVDNEHNLTTADIVVNASPLGMRGQAPMPEAVLRAIETAPSSLVVFDMIYDPHETDLLAAARRSGHRTVDGLALLIAQARHAFSLFYGVPPPPGCDGELRELLTR